MNGMDKNNTTQFSNGHDDTSQHITKINHQLHKTPKSYPPSIQVLLH